MTNIRPRVALDGHYSMAETASLLEVDPSTVYRWRRSGYMKTHHYRHSKLPFIFGREILKIFDVYAIDR